MKTFFFKFSFLAICLPLIFTSCKKNDSIPEKGETGIEVREGMLSFSNQEVFSNTLKMLSAKNLSEVDTWLSQFGYKSLNSDTTDEQNRIFIYDPLFRRILNDKYSVKIGNDIFFIKDGSEYLINDGNMSTYSTLQNGGSEGSVNNVKIKSLNPASVELKVESISPFQGTRGYYSPEYDNGRPERIYMEIYSQSFAVYASQGVLIRGQAYRRGGVFGSKKWRDDEMYKARISGMEPIPSSAFGQAPFDTGLQFNQTEINHTIRRWDASNGTIPANPVLRNLDVTFEYQKGTNNPSGSLTERVDN
nr:hypothetical protein [uncultured Pedobacter sp.]